MFYSISIYAICCFLSIICGFIAICRRFFWLDAVIKLQSEVKLFFFPHINNLKKVNAVALSQNP